MSNFNYHPAPGVENGGAMSMPAGFHIIPNSAEGVRQHGVQRKRGIAEIIPGAWTIPQNPIKSYVTGNVKPLGTSGCGCGCGGHGGCGQTGSLNGIPVGGGMGDISTDLTTFTTALGAGNFSGALSDTIMGVPAWVYLAGIAAVMFMDFGSGSAAVRGKRAVRAGARAY